MRRAAGPHHQRQCRETGGVGAGNRLTVFVDDRLAAIMLPDRQLTSLDNRNHQGVRKQPLHLDLTDPPHGLHAVAKAVQVQAQQGLISIDSRRLDDIGRRHGGRAQDFDRS